jgi:mannose/fructose/N-acetylgalactosamine-specific phosphotransferase system component IID
MQNLGLLVALLPWLRDQNLDLQARRRFCRRHYEFFNTNPYLANYIIGGLLWLETEERAGNGQNGSLARTFKDSLARSFASLGDQLFWLGLQPALLLLASLVGFWAGIWPALGLVVLFALLQLELRRRALGTGYRLGLDLVDLLARPIWHRFIRTTIRAALLLVGGFAGCHLARNLAREAEFPIQSLVLLCLVGVALPLVFRKRVPGEGLLLMAVPLALVLASL